ncbi:protein NONRESPONDING TO OXYLIPINS 2, mitochondrial isoform X3 [Prosopis cineraria]|uniref:protein NONRESPONDING TO OXYLIPINS 2, mitochondrial isoform X3 n=1 Tax=Prosopis cineraria TaxID=364024 RepID=UPI00240F4491|nr:protein NONRESPONDING TO OXYLIPINS 2, mitochondrial isoform X3 [Prosopis cineraria]
MALACSRMARRIPISSIKAALNSNVRNSSFCRSASIFTTPSNSTFTPLLRSFLIRTAAELGCLQSMLPLHSVVAAARMTSCLSATSRSCRALSQELGLSVPR